MEVASVLSKGNAHFPDALCSPARLPTISVHLWLEHDGGKLLRTKLVLSFSINAAASAVLMA